MQVMKAHPDDSEWKVRVSGKATFKSSIIARKLPSGESNPYTYLKYHGSNTKADANV